MAQRNDGGSAFPIRGISHDEDIDARDPGMSLRDWYVGMAIQGMLANPGGPIQYNPHCGWGMTNCNAADVVDTAHEIADAAIAGREN